jgi:hypothetical protein
MLENGDYFWHLSAIFTISATSVPLVWDFPVQMDVVRILSSLVDRARKNRWCRFA